MSTIVVRRSADLFPEETKFCVAVNGPTTWNLLSRGAGTRAIRQFELDYLERESIALADAAVICVRIGNAGKV